MVQAIITLEEHADRVLNVVKGKYGFKNKSDAVNFVISKFEEGFLEPEVRPEYLEKLSKIEAQKGKRYKNFKDFEKEMENA